MGNLFVGDNVEFFDSNSSKFLCGTIKEAKRNSTYKLDEFVITVTDSFGQNTVDYTNVRDQSILQVINKKPGKFVTRFGIGSVVWAMVGNVAAPFKVFELCIKEALIDEGYLVIYGVRNIFGGSNTIYNYREGEISRTREECVDKIK